MTISHLPLDLRKYIGRYLYMEERANVASCSKTLYKNFRITTSPNKVQILYMTIRWADIYRRTYEHVKDLHLITTWVDIFASVLWVFGSPSLVLFAFWTSVLATVVRDKLEFNMIKYKLLSDQNNIRYNYALRLKHVPNQKC